ncbi:MAG: S1C family serine protease [Phototrophicaceae bacterium]|jgi:S1-C subfamily serine protease
MSLLQALNDDLASLASGVTPSLVVIQNGRGQGAGTIWQSDGLIVTNAHVVGRNRQVGVVLPDGTLTQGRVLAIDEQLDLATLSIDAHGLPAIPVGDSTALHAGEWVIAIGHPWGIRNAVTQGVVIGSGEQLPERPSHGRDWLAMSLHLRPGHSGGAVLNSKGELVGVNTIMAGPEVGIAVPSHVAKGFVKEAITRMWQVSSASGKSMVV